MLIHTCTVCSYRMSACWQMILRHSRSYAVKCWHLTNDLEGHQELPCEVHHLLPALAPLVFCNTYDIQLSTCSDVFYNNGSHSSQICQPFHHKSLILVCRDVNTWIMIKSNSSIRSTKQLNMIMDMNCLVRNALLCHFVQLSHIWFWIFCLFYISVLDRWFYYMWFEV